MTDTAAAPEGMPATEDFAAMLEESLGEHRSLERTVDHGQYGLLHIRAQGLPRVEAQLCESSVALRVTHLASLKHTHVQEAKLCFNGTQKSKTCT